MPMQGARGSSFLSAVQGRMLLAFVAACTAECDVLMVALHPSCSIVVHAHASTHLHA